MKRRHFLAASMLAAAGPLAGSTMAADANSKSDKDYIELRRYSVATAEKQKLLIEFLGKAAIPAYGRIGIGPVGVFTFDQSEKPIHDVYVLLTHKSPLSAATANAKLMADAKYLSAGASLLNAPADDPAYQRIESSLMIAFDGEPKVKSPAKGAKRIFQLRIYESHNAKKAAKKIEMFNSGGEFDIFRRVGLKPVFFGEVLVGERIPNLTYMLGFDSAEQGKENWKKFFADPQWGKLKNDPQYKNTVSNITNIFLKPAACSQI
jgi:hypothetical protein